MSDLLSAEAQRRINFTQHTRERLAQNMLEGGALPKDPEDVNTLLKVLDSMDRTDITVAKLKVDDKAATGALAVQEMVANLLLNATTVRKPSTPLPQEIPDELSVIDLVPGETDTGVKTFTYEEMVAPKT